MSSIEALSRVLLGRSGGGRVLALLAGYFDESGTHEGAEVTAIGGYVAAESDWAALEQRWRAALDEFQLSHMHLTDLTAGRGEFAKVFAIRDLVAKRFGAIVEESSISPLAIAIHARVWESATTPEFREIYPKPYDLCFSHTMRDIQRWRSRHAQGQRCALVFATQQEYEDRNRKTLAAWHKYGATSLGLLAFELAKCQPALQPADMLANQSYVAWSSVGSGEARPGKVLVTDLYKQLTRNTAMDLMFMTEIALKLFVKNEDWMNPSFSCPAYPDPWQ
jgi:hypothetical protein